MYRILIVQIATVLLSDMMHNMKHTAAREALIFTSIKIFEKKTYSLIYLVI